VEEQTNNYMIGVETNNSIISDTCLDYTNRNFGYNFIIEDFQGITRRRTRCLECECVTERKEPFYDIPVPILELQDEKCCPKPTSELYRRACVTYEKLCDSNKYLCEICKRYNEASREVSFEKLPNVMVMQLKRFMTTSVGVQKVNSHMPTPLEMSCFCDACYKHKLTHDMYQLCCVIMHLGGSMASGHYIAYVRASEQIADYINCTKDPSKRTSSEKSLNILKYFKPKSKFNIENKNDLSNKNDGVSNTTWVCKSR